MRIIILSLILFCCLFLLFFTCFNALAQTPIVPIYKVQVGTGEDDGMIWKDVVPQPTMVTTQGAITEKHNYLDVFGNQKWVFSDKTGYRTDFTISMIDPTILSYKLKIVVTAGTSTLESIPSERVYNMNQDIFKFLMHIVTGK
jgi:hypothetical protein